MDIYSADPAFQAPPPLFEPPKFPLHVIQSFQQNSHPRYHQQPPASPPPNRNTIALRTILKLSWLYNRDPALASSLPLVLNSDPQRHDIFVFCDKPLYDQILDVKSKLSEFIEPHLNKARSTCNPYEQIGSLAFINRAAVKLSEIDAACHLLHNLPTAPHDTPLVHLDLCAAPGGFSEYVRWRASHVQSIGVSLETTIPFHAKCLADPHFHAFCGTNGDICDYTTITSVTQLVQERTAGHGACLVTCDGGVDGTTPDQQFATHKLVFYQVYCAFLNLARDGQLVLKVYELTSPLMVGLFAILHAAFKRVAVVKPVSSRPANSERYVVAQGLFTYRPALILDHFNSVRALLDQGSDVSELVCVDHVHDCVKDYLVRVGGDLARSQLDALVRFYDALPEAAEADDRSPRAKSAASPYSGLVRACLRRWNLAEFLHLLD